MTHPVLIFSQSDYLIWIVAINSVQIQISWLLNWIYTVCKDRVHLGSAGQGLIFTTFCANSADYRLVIFFLFFSENRLCHFMQTVSLHFHKRSKFSFLENNNTNICKCPLLNFFLAGLALTLSTQQTKRDTCANS